MYWIEKCQTLLVLAWDTNYLTKGICQNISRLSTITWCTCMHHNYIQSHYQYNLLTHHFVNENFIMRIRLMVFNTTFNNISGNQMIRREPPSRWVVCRKRIFFKIGFILQSFNVTCVVCYIDISFDYYLFDLVSCIWLLFDGVSFIWIISSNRVKVSVKNV